MYKKILAAVNEHLNSEVSARYALYLAKEAHAGITFCSIAEKGLTDKSFRLAEEAVKRLSNRARELGVKADCVLETGMPLKQITKIVDAEGIDIVFAATRREDVEKRFFARTVARGLLLSLRCSVALVRVVNMGRILPREILVPVKEHIDHIPERSYFASMLAKSFGSKIHLFHTTKPLKKFFHGETYLTPLEWERNIPPDISRFIGHLDQYNVEHEKRLASGMTGKSIAIEAAARRRDLIIMGASERGFFNLLLKGNPVEYVLRETPCNLIILRPEQ